jgi:hypothetical protein
MRLTLRTLLAYLDNILDEKDADELRRKIEDSDFAQGLVQRIESANTRSRLGTPPVDGKGIGLDPNSVAEYLDNILPPDRVPDLERICLESDVHLAEVASCHQILTIVLEKGAHVDPGLRERIYRIGAPDTHRTPPSAVSPAGLVDSQPLSPDELGRDGTTLGASYEPPPLPAPPPQVAPSGRGRSPIVRRAKAVVPDYLRAGRRSTWKPLVVTLLLAFLLSAVALRAMGPFDRNHPLLRFVGGGPAPLAHDGSSEPHVVVDESDSAKVADPITSHEEDPSPPVPGRVDGADQLPLADGKQAEPEDLVTSDDPQRIDRGPLAEQPQERGPSDQQSHQAEPVRSEFPETQPLPPEVEMDIPIDEDAHELQPELAEEDHADSGGAVGEPVEVGFVKIKDLHFPMRFDHDRGQWYRLPARSKLFSGDRLRVLPTYHPEIVLTPSVQLVFAGPSSVELGAPTDGGEPTLVMDYGRAFISTAGVPNTRLRLKMGERSCVVTFLDAASEIALETRNFLPLGAHPERDPPQRVVRVFPMIGRIEWQDDQQASPVPVEEGQVRVLVDSSAETVGAGELPSWILREDLREIDRSASAVLEGFLAADRPITLSLRERMQDRRTEIRALAAISLSHLDVHEALIADLDDPRQRAHWAAEFEALRSAIARDPESAAAVRRELEKRFPNTAEEAYRLLFGFSPQQLAEGADEKLVRLLDHPSMCLRILAFENLRRITGMTLLYRPNASDELRKSSVRGWRERVDNRAILYDIPPSPTSDRW